MVTIIFVMPQGNLLHTGYPYMQITQIKHFNKLVISNLHKNLKQLGKKVFKYSIHIKKTSFYTTIELVFYNELLIEGVYLLEPLPGTCHTSALGVPVSAGPMQRLEQTHAVKFKV